GFEVTHVYGLTETFGHITHCAWQDQWNDLEIGKKAEIKSRQGVRFPMMEGVLVAEVGSITPVPADGESMGEILVRGNSVMKGYYKNPEATLEAFAEGWYHSGDLAVVHPDGYIQIRDRLKDVIISGGENISSVEVEGALYKHPSVAFAAVVAKPDEKWGESPCAFVELKSDCEATEDEIIEFCRDHMAHFKRPKTVIFCEIPKTSTGKIQKFILREQARNM
ncbi:MAG: AMP-binding protein, partial [Rhodospirillales bacterium]|nr:AMP-binding protein [Rhodospirillales bacterium]